jgi:NAD(P)-dependent dehydrogenase (short-subunit alcohol dehydrogenase family)
VQAADHGYDRVIVTARTAAKAASSRQEVVRRTGHEAVDTLVLDFDDLTTVHRAVATLRKDGRPLHTLILNAGIGAPPQRRHTSDRLEATAAASLVGHHVLVTGILDAGLLGDDARIVISGSEAARGDVPTFHPVDLHELATRTGDLDGAIEAQLRGRDPAPYRSTDVYATVKVLVVWWAAELAQRLPGGATVNAVSPGSTPSTNAARNATRFMRWVMMPLLRVLPGMSHDAATGAARYLEIAHVRPAVTGRFFASRPGRMTGQLTVIDAPHLSDETGGRTLWTVLERITAATTAGQQRPVR